MEFAFIYNKFTASLTVALIVATIYLLLHRPKIVDVHRYMLTAVLGLGSLASVLIYSEIIGYEPCSLCWTQRIILIGIVAISLLPKWTFSDWSIRIISAAGIIISLYQYYLQMSQTGSFCTVGETSCSAIFVKELGFITIPFMALVLFSFVLVVHIPKKSRPSYIKLK
ncbi:disulfide bond formation protein B [Candidatus Woesearchaeota archaeon]|nr:disulfide bond formation protein B [Candidatus Woesearchaeota archaeon]